MKARLPEGRHSLASVLRQAGIDGDTFIEAL